MNENNLESKKPLDDEVIKGTESANEHPAERDLTKDVVLADDRKSEEKTAEMPQAEEEKATISDKEDTDVVQQIEKPVVAESEKETEIDYNIENQPPVEDSAEDEDEINENNITDLDSAVLLPIDEIVQKFRDLFASEYPQRKEVDEVKNQFYRSLRDETEAQKAAFIAAGGESINFVAEESELYAEGKELIQKIKDKRAEIIAQEEAEKEKNVAKKMAIIEQIKAFTEAQSHEDFNKSYQEFRNLQQQWNEIKLIPQAKVNDLWKEYQRYVEKFYDLVRINNEFREYDFKKNFELKTELCEAAERLDEETDIISAFHQLQNLHQEWRDVGPVARKDREEIWNRFKNASTVINKKYQSHFEGQKEKEEANLVLKTELCEQLEAIDYASLKTIKDWNAKIKTVLEIQSKWREIGYVPKKWNAKIYERYRAACDFFFRNKNDFYKSIYKEMDENLKKKTELCERAEALKDSQDWKATTQELINIQKEWKAIGVIPRKFMDSTWKRFIAACDYFFEQKKIHNSSQHSAEAQNLELKKEIIEKIKQMDTSLTPDQFIPQLRELMDEWYGVGHVPFKAKDKIYKEFHAATEAHFERMNIEKAERRFDNFKYNISDMAKSDNASGQLHREREKLMRQYERMKSELQTYENNIGFLSVSSKKGNSLLDDMNHKMEKIKSELAMLVKKIEAIDKEL